MTTGEALPVAAPRSGPAGPQAARKEPWRGFPSLLVYAHATADGMRVSATLYRPLKAKNGEFEVLFRHQWKPREVTELAIVEWAEKALARLQKLFKTNPTPRRAGRRPPRRKRGDKHRIRYYRYARRVVA